MRLFLMVGFCVLIFGAAVPKTTVSADDTNACSVTNVPATPFVPPIPYQAVAAPNSFWFGTNGLWTSLEMQGVWRSLPRRDDGYFNKLFLWQEGYDVRKEPKPDIIVILRRLDADVPLVVSRGGTNAHFGGAWAMLTGVTFPTEGCWEITSYHAGRTLTFVVSVQP
jgi:hypothetical protein